MVTGFLHPWLVRLREMVVRLEPQWHKRHRDFLMRSFQLPGGWAGRQGPPNPYYTGFGLRGLFLLEGLSPELLRASGRFLQRLPFSHLAPADVFAVILVQPILGEVILPPRRVITFLAQLVRPDGGFAATAASSEGSVFATFLAVEAVTVVNAVLQENCGEFGTGTFPSAEQILGFLLARQRRDGGFAEASAAPLGAVPTTVAALATLRLLEVSAQEAVKRACDFIVHQQDLSGGFRVGSLAPAPDLLSTALGLLALADFNYLKCGQLRNPLPFIEGCESPSGGYRSDPTDETPDVEYTFYGVLARGICEAYMPATVGRSSVARPDVDKL